MPIPLDYYRLLGIPPEATLEQIDRAYQDAYPIIPHREFSEVALAARCRLLEKAHTVLSNPASRQDYDQTTGLVLTSEDVLGALLVLYTFGYYTEVINLIQESALNESIAQPDEASLLNADRALVLALAQQALGVEQWQEGNYAEAGTILESAQESLMEQGLFLHVRGEIQSYLLNLRPPRILDLLIQSDPDRREQGLRLLREMLNERQGIDGQGNDYSGLSTEQFLHFIQKIRHNLTTLEQQQIFEEEAKRPSAVASYLTAYALAGRGFAEYRPDFIRRAKGILVKLSLSQDVHLERSLCALLLGETEEALAEITHSKEYSEIAGWHLHADQPPDLLENLCRYCERWLEQEVFPHFADLIGKSPSLTTYFADEKVETYLEELPGMSTSEWVVSALPRPTAPSWKAPSFSSSSPPSPPLTETSMDKQTETDHPSRKRSSRLPIKLFLSGVGIFVGLAAGAGAWIWRQQNPQTLNLPTFNLPSARSNSPLVLIQRPLLRSIATASDLKDVTTLTKELAAQIITQWQNAKTLALGSTHQIEQLETILSEPSLTEWRERAEQYKKDNSYLEYITKGIEVKTLTLTGKDQAEVVATISEDRNFFDKGVRDDNSSRAGAQYEVVYRLVLRDESWRIEEMLVK